MIRPATPQDVSLLQAIENDADGLFIERFEPEHWWPASSGEKRTASPGFVLVAAEDGGTAIGFVHVTEIDGIAHLEQLSVMRSRSRRGWGRTLVEAAKCEGARRGHAEMSLRTYADVPWNAPFYETLGFRPSEPETDFHRRRAAVEADLGLARYGRRIQMTARLSPCE